MDHCLTKLRFVCHRYLYRELNECKSFLIEPDALITHRLGCSSGTADHSAVGSLGGHRFPALRIFFGHGHRTPVGYHDLAVRRVGTALRDRRSGMRDLSPTTAPQASFGITITVPSIPRAQPPRHGYCESAWPHTPANEEGAGPEVRRRTAVP